jgi:hypothetical protein
MRWYIAGLVTATAFLCSGAAKAGSPAATDKPHLALRATPRVSFSPVEIFAVGELKGGGDAEEFYCPGQVWDWGDGTRSARESDCSPYKDGTSLERFFSARHAFRTPGTYAVRLFLVRAGKTITMATVPVMVYGHFGGGVDSGE